LISDSDIWDWISEEFINFTDGFSSISDNSG